MAEKFFKDNDSVGRTLGDKLMRRVQDTDDFRTVMYDTPEGQVMLKTKGGNPELSIKRKEVVEEPVTECIASPLIEIAFKHGTPAEPVDPERNPFTLTSGYRTWHGENDPGVVGSPATVPEIQYSSDGLLYTQVRKPKKMRFLDKQNRTVDLVLARKPTKDSDADNVEYDGTNTFSVVAKAFATAAGAVSRFIFSEGRYRYREWYAPRSVNIDWCLPVNTSAVRFLMRRLKKLTLLVWDSTKPAGQEKTVDWFFTEPGIQDMPGSQPDTACANQNGREVSYTNRQFFAEKGHMKEARFRVGYQNQNGGTADFRLEFKRPGSFLSQIDPEAVVSRTGNHPGVDGSPDAAEIVAFGNPYHGLMWVDGSGYSTRVLYKDSSKTSQWPWTPAEPFWGLNPYGIMELEHQYYNVFGIENTLDINHVVKAPDSDEMYLKDAFLFHGAWYVREAATTGWGQLDFEYGNFVIAPPIYEFLYRDDAGVVWVVRAQWSRTLPSYVIESGKAKYSSNIGLTVTLRQRYGNIGENFSSPKAITKTLFSGTIPITWWQINTGVTLYPFATNADDARGAALYFRDGNNEGTNVLAAIYLALSGAGATEASEGVAIGDGISLTCTPETIQKQDYFSLTQTNVPIGSFVNKSVTLVSSGYSPYSCSGVNGEVLTSLTKTLGSPVTTDQYGNNSILTTVVDIYNERGKWKKVYSISHTYDGVKTVAYSNIVDAVLAASVTGCSGTIPIVTNSVYQTGTYTETNTYHEYTTVSITIDGEVVDSKTRHKKTEQVISKFFYPLLTPHEGTTSSVTTETVTINSVGDSRVIPNTEPNALTTRFVFSVPTGRITGDTFASYPTGFSPVGWAITLTRNGSTTQIAKDLPVNITYRKSKVAATAEEIAQRLEGTNYYSASVGWAYNYRTGELIKTPFGAYAYFV